MKLKNKIVFISGANSGIGQACAEQFAKKGAKLILCSRNLDKLIKVAEKINEKYDTEILTYQLDVSDRKNILPFMFKNNAGHIINIGSIAAVAAYPKGAVYCGVKAASKAISDGLRMDTVDTPIRVTNIQPGLVETNFSVVRFHGDKKKADNVYKGLKALAAEDIADIVLYSAEAPDHVQICEVTVTPTAQASGTVVHRN
jgi:3-hydroxy acid dehydrogenase/malonic semialdehyde reductase